MKRIYNLLLAAGLTTALFSSCDKRHDIIGVWTGTPTSITNIDPAIDANATYTLEFMADNKSGVKNAGELMISVLINANQAVSANEQETIAPYETSVAATATVNGKWTFARDEDDDVVIILDPQTLSVKVDPEGVTFAQNIMSGEQQPVTDSLTTATVAAWQTSITKVMRDNLFSVSEISDIEIHNGNIMSCEIHGRDYSFRSVQ